MQTLAASTKTCSVRPLDCLTNDGQQQVVNAILHHPQIAARVGHDHRPAGYIAHPDVAYLGAYLDGALVGVFTLVDSGFVEIDIHAALLPYALPHARALGRQCLDHVFRRDPDLARATAYVIEGLDSAVNYCLKLGFQREGFRRDACMKGGRLVGVHVLGITRGDWETTR
ncbi:MAG: N-acetyltransferase [Caulobacteraceae bacterium]|nr:N-acetyltransferase [Caulobacteraceae bacterium]